MNYKVFDKTGRRQLKDNEQNRVTQPSQSKESTIRKKKTKPKVIATRKPLRKATAQKLKMKTRKQVLYPHSEDNEDDQWEDAEPLSKVLRNGKFVLPDQLAPPIEEDVEVEETTPDPDEYKLYYVPKKKLLDADQADIQLPYHATANPKVIEEIRRKLEDNFTTVLTAEQIGLLQDMDPALSKIKAYITSGKTFKSKREQRSIARKATSFAVISGLLFFLPFDEHKPKSLLYKPLLAVPEKLMTWIVTQLHSESTSAIHSSPNALYLQFKQHFWRPNAYTLIKSIVKACTICQQATKRNDDYYDVQQKHQIRKAKPLEKWYLDFTAMPQHGNYIGFIIGKDAGSGMLVAEKCTSFTTQVATNFIQSHILNTYGSCKEIVMDNAASFHSQQMTDFLKKHNIKPIFTTKWNPHANLSELGNKHLKTALQKLMAQLKKSWTELLQKCVAAINQRPNRITEKSSYEILYGFPPHNRTETNLPFIEDILPEGSEEERRKLLKDITESLTEAQEVKIDQKRADSLRQRPVFAPGDLCLALTLNHKLSLPSSRKFKFYHQVVRILAVISKHHSLVQELESPEQVRKVHNSHLRKLHQIPSDSDAKSKLEKPKIVQTHALKSEHKKHRDTRRFEKKLAHTWNKILKGKMNSIYSKNRVEETEYEPYISVLFKQ